MKLFSFDHKSAKRLHLAILLCLFTIHAAAQETPPEPRNATPIAKPADLADTVSDLMKEGNASEVTVAPAGTVQQMEVTGGDLGAMRKEMQSMSDSLKQLQETLDFLVNRVMADLEAENAQLRQEVQRIYGKLGEQGLDESMSVPRPGRDLIEQVLKERTETAARQNQPEDPQAAQASPAETAPAEPVPFSCTTVDEWGRSPEAAAELGPNTTSVKGLVCVVPPGSSKDDLSQLGRELRKKYDAYDNLNIEVFDNEAAARNYADRHIVDQDHRVLSVSKHKESNRDAIFLVENGVPTEISQ